MAEAKLEAEVRPLDVWLSLMTVRGYVFIEGKPLGNGVGILYFCRQCQKRQNGDSTREGLEGFIDAHTKSCLKAFVSYVTEPKTKNTSKR